MSAYYGNLLLFRTVKPDRPGSLTSLLLGAVIFPRWFALAEATAGLPDIPLNYYVYTANEIGVCL